MSEGAVFLGFMALMAATVVSVTWGFVAMEKARIAALLELGRLAAAAEAQKGQEPSPASSPIVKTEA